MDFGFVQIHKLQYKFSKKNGKKTTSRCKILKGFHQGIILHLQALKPHGFGEEFDYEGGKVVVDWRREWIE